jgi:hypothetical protein
MIRRWKKSYLPVFLCVVIGPSLFPRQALKAQPLRLSASVDSTNYPIGDWITVHISAEHSFNTEMLWKIPLKLDTSVFHIIAESDIDTIEQKDFVTENKSLTLTTYDTGILRIPSLVFYYRKRDLTDSASTASIVIFVAPVAVDISEPYRPLKMPLAVDVYDDKRWLYLVSGFSIVAAVCLYWFFMRKKKKREAVAALAAQDLRLPYEKALDNLEALEEESLWVSGKTKEYYVRVTQILREYIENGLQLPALENTTNEIIRSLRKKTKDEDLLKQLKDDLTVADFVKFAKAKPAEDVHLRIIETVRRFIEATKPVLQENLKAEGQTA